MSSHELASRRNTMKRAYTKRAEKSDETEPPKKRPVGRPPRDTPKKEKATSVQPDDATNVKVNRPKPLPVVEEFEANGRTAYKSIAESGVLATSLIRSKTRWTIDGLFDKYWTKPSKKKGQIENAANNPPKETMQKAGSCFITIEPHVFEAQVHSVRDLNPPPLSANAHSVTPMFQYGPVPAFTPNISSQTAQNQSHTTPVQSQGPFAQPPQQLSPSKSQQHTQGASSSNSQAQTPQGNGNAPSSNAGSTSTANIKSPTPAPSTAQPPASNPPAQQGQDPVIQMLAQRASTNPELKVLMKIVASGSADTEQLRVFQSHIDDLTAILNRQNQHKPAHTPTPSQPNTPNFQPHSALPKGQFGTLSASNQTMNPTGTPLYQPINRPNPSQNVMKPKPSTGRSDIIGALIEFPGISGDRYSIPKNSILEYLPGGRQVLISFIITRKGSDSQGNNYNPSTEYWEPITMRLTTDSPKVLDVLGRAVAPYEDACKWMDETMKRATRAETVHLAFRLPKQPDSGDEADTNFLTPAEADRVRSLKSLGTRASPGSGLEEKPKKWARIKHQEDWDQNCQYCYAPPESTYNKDPGGRPICADCDALRRASAAASRTVRYSDNAPDSRGPQALVLSF